MTAAMAAAVAATLGIIIGRFWDVRSEAARWRRDQMTASYQRMAEVFRKTTEGIRAVALTAPGDELFAEKVDRVRADSSWDDAYSAVWLHGSPAVVEAARELDLAMTELFYDAQDGAHRIEDWYRLRIPARDAFENFLEAVRDELKLKVVAVKYFPDVPRQVPSPVPERP
ncbi:hypothetical protein ACFVMC_00390 [Nocardia sp. NPDC127579]|uniref:hypothetical protein n=1 Tax=Nocardia sp. NPDC127579 TaxID=3345402 RepID=UPI00363733B7